MKKIFNISILSLAIGAASFAQASDNDPIKYQVAPNCNGRFQGNHQGRSYSSDTVCFADSRVFVEWVESRKTVDDPIQGEGFKKELLASLTCQDLVGAPVANERIMVYSEKCNAAVGVLREQLRKSFNEGSGVYWDTQKLAFQSVAKDVTRLTRDQLIARLLKAEANLKRLDPGTVEKSQSETHKK
ncbi:MAG TPA: hypothetical protein VM901_00785 [Bdellovibrionota bacterium]|jgi:hypothetical protein|nr:hypothetical protein [Bdellovibrionota bacterium]